MKKGFNIFIFVLLFTIISSTRVFAANSAAASGIVIDGSFEDWQDKPLYSDYEHDIKSPWLDFLNVRYYADEKYLYLYVTRQAAHKSLPWNFDVVILNGVKGTKYEQHPFGQSSPIYVPNYHVNVDFADNRNNDGAAVNVSFDNENIETSFSAASNGKEIEFRLPLDRVGLDGPNKEVKFALKSETDDKTGEIDWVADNGPIVVTTGPTLWQASSTAAFVFVSFGAYRIYRNKKEKHSAKNEITE